jgi:two-component sensor histidine kinase
MLTNDDLSLFSVVLKDPRRDDGELIADDRGTVTARIASPDGPAPSMIRTVTFGGRDWSLGYYAKTNAIRRAQQTAAIVAAIGIALTSIVCGLFGYVAYSNLRLRREIEVRIGFERRLTAVIDELNHRVKNILAVIQSIVTRTLRHGSDIDVARELLIGRIHAMSNVVSLLSESQWQGVQLKGLFESRAIPHADRIAVTGPDIAVSARAAQSLSLLFFELASHSDEGLSLVGKHPNIKAHWEVTGEGSEAVFHFRWEESNTSAATRRADGNRHRHDGTGPHRSAVGAGAAGVLERRFCVPRTQRSAPLFAAWCAAEPGPYQAPAFVTVPVLRSSAKSAASRPGHGPQQKKRPPR